MEQAIGKVRLRLKRVAEGVAEVEKGAAVARLALVLGDDPGLAGGAGGDGMVKRGATPAKKDGAVLFQPGEEGGVLDQRIFDDLGIAGAELARVERAEHERVDQHPRGLVERTDEVLASRHVDCGLATHRAVDLGEEAGRYLHETAAAIDDGGGEADEIADDAAAERDDMVAALDAEGKAAVDQLRKRFPALARLAGREKDRRRDDGPQAVRSDEHTSELQSLSRLSYAVFCLKKKNRSR